MPGGKTPGYIKWAREKRPLLEARTKYETMCHYSIKKIPICECCGECLFELLAIDHTNGGGAELRSKKKEEGGQHLAKSLRSRGYPKGYRILCHNCNMAVAHYLCCPHKGKAIKKSSRVKASRAALCMRERREGWKTEVFEHYGNKCACCGESRKEFLTIDHINGKGKNSLRSWDLCRDIIRKEFPDYFRVLCANCNFVLSFFGYCPHQVEGDYKEGLDAAWGKLYSRKPEIPIHKGENNGAAKLTNHQARRIKGFYRRGYTQVALGKKFGVSQVQIGRIVNGVHFKEINPCLHQY